jgi:NAD(P)H-hydrate epimerase
MRSNSLTNCQQLAERVLTIAQARTVDRQAIEQYHMNSLVLMENAGLGCVHWLRSKFSGRKPKTLILCGSGNNGGDGVVIARHLRVLGWPCVVVMRGPLEKLSADARANVEILIENEPEGVLWWDSAQSDRLRAELSSSELILDAMLGTGATGNPRPPFDGWIEAANLSEALRVAIDVPSGVNADTGAEGNPRFWADATLTFVAKKPAMAQVEFASIFGELQVLPIGLPEQLIRALLALAD